MCLSASKDKTHPIYYNLELYVLWKKEQFPKGKIVVSLQFQVRGNLKSYSKSFYDGNTKYKKISNCNPCSILEQFKTYVNFKVYQVS